MAANGTDSLVFINDGTVDKSRMMNSEVYRAIFCASALCFKIQFG